jgi:hypothetical protein
LEEQTDDPNSFRLLALYMDLRLYEALAKKMNRFNEVKVLDEVPNQDRAHSGLFNSG